MKGNQKQGDEPCYYKVLDVSHDATPSEIRKSFRSLARKYHPDKARFQNRNKANPQDLEPAALLDNKSGIKLSFSLISRAYEILSDQTKREEYNILHGFSSGLKHLLELRRSDALRAQELMKLTFDYNRRQEFRINGLVIDNAIYGAKDILEFQDREIMEKSTLTINVTRALQCLVDRSKLVLPDGEAKHEYISGFYDPCPGEEKLLFIKYFFLGRLHTVIVEEKERLVMPLKSHCVEPSKKKHQERRRRKRKKRLRKDKKILTPEANFTYVKATLLMGIAVGSLVACLSSTRLQRIVLTKLYSETSRNWNVLTNERP